MRHRRRLTMIALVIVLTALGCRDAQRESRSTAPAETKAPLIDTQPEDPNRSPLVAKLTAQLEDAYRSSSPTKLAAFLDTWHASVDPAEIEEIADSLERELYSLFQDFYNPSGLNAIAGGNGYSDVVERYESVNYIIVQNSLNYRLAELDPEEGRTLTDFRPHIELPNHRVLYLTPNYREAIIAFLTKDEHEAKFTANKFERTDFLSKYLMVSLGHWAGWDLLTPPTVEFVELNRTKTEATVYSMVSSDGAVTTMKLTPVGWRMENTGILFIQ